MEALAHLWLPIVLSAVAVWIASAIIWMALPHHAKDFSGLPDEKGFCDSIRGIAPGVYGFPHAETKAQCRDPEFAKRMAEGPSGILNVWGKMSIGRNMVLTFVVYLVVSTLIAYVGIEAHLSGQPFAKIMQVLGTVGVLAYCFAFIPNGIWFQQKPRALLMNILDGVVYGLVTGAVFAWRMSAMDSFPIPHM